MALEHSVAVGGGPAKKVLLDRFTKYIPHGNSMLTVTSVTSRSVVVSWQIDTSTIPFTGYMVRVVAASTGQIVFSDGTLSSENLLLTLRDLQPTTDYQFFISAFNTAGTGEQVSIAFRTISNGKPLFII